MASLDLLIGIYCHQKAIGNLIIDDLVNKGTDRVELLQTYTDDLQKSKDSLMKTLFENYGELNLKDILGK